MYYNKNLFVNEQLKTQFKKLLKKQLIVLFSIIAAALVLYIGTILQLVMLVGKNFPIGYAIPALGATLFVALFAANLPIANRLNKLRAAQTEEMKDTVYGEKYAALLQAGKNCEKLSYYLIIPSVVLSLIISLIVSIFFPYEYYYSYFGLLLSSFFLVCIVFFIPLSRKRKAVKNAEIDLADLFAKQYEIENTKEPQQTQD